ncbi:DHH subfamily 1 protein, partial [gut metagenome]
MKNRPRFTLEVITVGLLVFCIVLTSMLAVWNPRLLWALVPILALTVLGLWMAARIIRRYLADYVTSNSTEKGDLIAGLSSLQLPVLLLSGKTILWYNEAFRQKLLGGEDLILQPVSRALPGLDLRQCVAAAGQDFEKEGRRYTIFAGAPLGKKQVSTLYLVDDTDVKNQASEY